MVENIWPVACGCRQQETDAAWRRHQAQAGQHKGRQRAIAECGLALLKLSLLLPLFEDSLSCYYIPNKMVKACRAAQAAAS
jgi:hypothetical protein